MQLSVKSCASLLSKALQTSSFQRSSSKFLPIFSFTPNARRLYSTEPSPVLVEVNDQVQWIRLNRPKAYNAMNLPAYRAVITALHSAAENDLVKMTVVTGTGPLFSSGNDLNNNRNLAEQQLSNDAAAKDLTEAAAAGHHVVQAFIDTFIDYPKPIIAAVNGPAYGIMVTTLAFYDAVIASETATFTAPFTRLAISPEGCSSKTFPRMLGPATAASMLMFSQTLSAERAYQLGFVSELVKKETDFEAFVNDWLHNPKRGVLSNCDYTSMVEAKALLRDEPTRTALKELNRREMEVLERMYARGEVFRIAEKLLKEKRKK